MAGLNYYAKLPAYENPAGWDTAPLSNALVELRKGREFDAQQDIRQQHLNNETAKLGLESDKASQLKEDRVKQQIAGITQYIAGLPEDDPNRQKLWSQFMGSAEGHPEVFQKYGQDPNDHINAPKFLLAQIQGPQDLEKKGLIEAQTAAAKSHGAYYDAAGKGLQDRNDIRRQDADTRRLKVGMDVLGRYGNKPPTEDVYNNDVQPGGFLHAAFNGAPPSYAELPRFMQMAQAQGRGLPDDAALMERGHSPKQVELMRRSKDLEGAYGPPKRGYRWDYDEKGMPAQVLMAEKEDAKQKAIDTRAPFYIQRLDMASKVLGDSSMAGRAIAAAPGGGYFNPTLREAREVGGHAVAALTAIVEGQRHANAMDVRMIKFFQPDPNDTHEITLFKLNEAQQFFKTWMSAKAQGRSEEYITSRFRSKLQQSYDSLLEKEGIKPKELPGSGKPGTPQGMSNEELLRRLNE